MVYEALGQGAKEKNIFGFNNFSENFGTMLLVVQLLSNALNPFRKEMNDKRMLQWFWGRAPRSWVYAPVLFQGKAG